MAKINLTKRSENFSEWYNQLVQHADLAENSAVRWCMVIKPYGYAIWENIQKILDQMFKNTGHMNAYFPLLIPKSFLSKEAEHVDWFAKECAVVTHHRLKVWDDWKSVVVDPEAKLDEELIIRPTSETVIWNTYKDWITSHRDLPLLINQWANVIRWEMRTRVFIRTTEFLRQEWHTAHATKEEAKKETLKMLDVYRDFCENFLASSPFVWQKSEYEKFAGAVATYTFEQIMQDGKALQSGTSHFLGQNFGKAFDVKYTNKDNKQEHVWGTSWWVSTRLMWWLVMSHSDDNGLVLPPAIAPIHLVIVPVFKSEEDLEKIKEYLKPLIESCKKTHLEFPSKYGNELQNHEKFDNWFDIKMQRKFDDDPQKSPGWKFNEWELKWVPLRIAVWNRDIENGTVELYKRFPWEKKTVTLEKLVVNFPKYLYKMQNAIFDANKKFREEHTFVVNSREEFKEKIQHGYVLAHRDGTTETEIKIKEETNCVTRCIPFDIEENIKNETGKCIYTGKPSNRRVLFARSY